MKKTLINIVSILCGITIAALSVALVKAVEKTPPTIVAPVTVVVPPANTTGIDEPVRVVQTEPITFVIPVAYWIAYLVYIATALGSVVVIWRFGIRAAAFVTDISSMLPVLRDIAKEFKNDAGSTLKDAIDRLEAAVEKAQKTAELAQKTADNLATVIKERAAK